MSRRFDHLVAEMPQLLKRLRSKPLLTRDDLGSIPKHGVYVFYQNNKPVYVGRSNNLKRRIQQHGRPSSGHNSATFAFTLAKERMESTEKIPKFITRKELEEAPGFAEAFFAARLKVTEMQIRVVEIPDQIEQAIFEIYAHLILNTKYNDFRTH